MEMKEGVNAREVCDCVRLWCDKEFECEMEKRGGQTQQYEKGQVGQARAKQRG